jgi:hypothetical protein
MHHSITLVQTTACNIKERKERWGKGIPIQQTNRERNTCELREEVQNVKERKTVGGGWRYKRNYFPRRLILRMR